MRFLRNRLDGMTVVENPPSDRRRVFFGAWVELEEDDGVIHRHRIVGPDEFDQAAGYISMDAPLRPQREMRQLRRLVARNFDLAAEDIRILNWATLH